MTSYKRFGWQSSLETFTSTAPRVIRKSLQDFLTDANAEQVRAWDQCIPWLQRECVELTARDAASAKYVALLEYELPRDLRRPDVIVLERGGVVVLEVKGHLHPSQAFMDQVFGYARDLQAYHSACASTTVTAVLVTRGGPKNPERVNGVFVTAPESVDALLEQLSSTNAPAVSIQDFLVEDAYAPLPSIVRAARELFHNRPLPYIKRARARTEPALKYITDLAHEAAKTRTRHLVLLSGVPGSGKTLVGLQLVHAHWLDDLAVTRPGGKPTAPAVYLSGNGPLVDVLQHSLREAGGGGQTFVQAIKKYVAYHSKRNSPPPEHLIVFDEAQRAHDPERVAAVHGGDVDKSEPEHLLAFCERIPEWCVLVALIGDGQAIHVGEEGGMPLWADALGRVRDRGSWIVHAASRVGDAFSRGQVRCKLSDALSLDTEIRFHLTPKVHDYVAGLLDAAPINGLEDLANELDASGHRFLVCRNLEMAKQYLRDRYSDAPYSRYGLLASSKDRWLLSFGVDNTFQTTKRLRVGPWYNDDPTSPQSCCQLSTVATEFASQGLELDCALVAWGSDLLWSGNQWSIEHSRGTRGMLRDPLSLRKNVYRVLLTRGRDGTVVFVPEDGRFDRTFDHLVGAGLRELR